MKFIQVTNMFEMNSDTPKRDARCWFHLCGDSLIIISSKWFSTVSICGVLPLYSRLLWFGNFEEKVDGHSQNQFTS